MTLCVSMQAVNHSALLHFFPFGYVHQKQEAIILSSLSLRELGKGQESDLSCFC